jgi:flagellar hook protein FlgE
MIGSLFAGISGLNANAMAMTVIGDNIANVNTTAFKSNRSSFANMLSQSLTGAGSGDIGRGVEFWGTSASWSQGNIENTASPTDMAVNGKGFFILQDDTGLSYYSRAGEFSFDRNGDLVNPDGLYVQGYEVTAVAPDGTMALGNISNINIPGESTTAASATTEFTVDVNLDAGAVAGDTYSTTLSVFDSLGNAIPLTITFTKQAAVNTWVAGVSVPSTVALPADVSINPSTLSFTPTGGLVGGGSDPAIAINNLLTGAAPLSLSWDIFDTAVPSVSHGDMTQYASASTTTFQTQNGNTSGVLRGVDVDEEGVVTGIYSNGQLVPLFQVALADFANYGGLQKLGQNLYQESRASGQALTGTPQDGALGAISPQTIEMSNVDLAQEFVKMIITQRAFQANARVITTSDEILSELINLKR